MKTSRKEVKARAFGTAVDRRGSVIAEGRALGRKKRLRVDWEMLADAWRAGYAPRHGSGAPGRIAQDETLSAKSGRETVLT